MLTRIAFSKNKKTTLANDPFHFRARIASREIIFRVNSRETCEKHIEECFSIGFERVLERYNVVECGFRSVSYTHLTLPTILRV